MLKKMSIKKIVVSASALFALFLIYLIPSNSTNDLDYDIKQELTYVDKKITTNDIFLMDDNNRLALTSVIVSSDIDIENKAKELLETLIIGSSSENKIPSGFKAILPNDTKILSIKYENNLIKVDFSKELLDVEQKLEEKIVESIVYTLTTIDEVKNVIIYVEGDILSYLPKSKITLPSTLNRSFGINKNYEINTMEDITGVTVYYISKYNDDYYYVPVTSYVNDEREKIKIIIDELASGSLYNTNLMSYLNSNTKLLAVEQAEDNLYLQFNSYIFEDMTEKNVLEEVINTISLSINDNYEVNQVFFYVDNEEIYKSVLKTIE